MRLLLLSVIREHHVSLEGARALHVVRFQFDVRFGRPAPRCSDHDDARFSDPGEADQVEVLQAWMVRPVQAGEAVRPLPQRVTNQLGESPRLLRCLADAAREGLN